MPPTEPNDPPDADPFADEPLFTDEVPPDPAPEPLIEAEVVDSDPAFEIVEPLACWRCGLFEPPAGGKCRKCRARLTDEDEAEPLVRSRTAPQTIPHGENRLTAVVVVYAFMLLTSVVWGWVLLADNGKMTDEQLRAGTAFVEFLDTILALAGLALVGAAGLPSPRPGARAAAWACAAPVLGALLVGNFLYAELIRQLVGVPRPAGEAFDGVLLLLGCVQPALVEELFFRYVAFGALRRATGPHATVWVTGVMFAVAHLYNPLGVPYLFVAGVVFGYARVWGGLALPMAMHFVHNLVVLAVEGI